MRTITAASIIALMAASVAVAQPTDAVLNWKPDPKMQVLAQPPASTVRDGFTFAAAGDILGGRPMLPLQAPGFDQISKVLKSADAAFANGEGAVFDKRFVNAVPMAENGGGYPLSTPGMAADLKAVGFSLIAKANNHATDWGVEGLLATLDELHKAGLVTAGAGRSLGEALAPGFLDTPHGRVSFVATASTFVGNSVASDSQGMMPARPGINVVRARRVLLVGAEELASLKAIAMRGGAKVAADARQVSVMGQAYRLSDTPGLTYEVNPYDRNRILRAVRGAKQSSDYTVFSIHAHETASGSTSDTRPADFLPGLYHDIIDAGADVVVAHGQHATRGIEIYKGRPIFYSLGSFAWMPGEQAITNELFEGLGLDPRVATNTDYRDRYFSSYPDEYYESVVATSRYAGGRLVEIRLHPIDLHSSPDGQGDRSGGTYGIPLPPSPAVARRILEKVQQDSAAFGTKVSIENGVGVIRLAGQ